MFDAATYAMMPFGFWTANFFVLGCVVGSFLNVCIHRMPRGESLIRPGSHCPHCNYAIPWQLNLPLITWLWLGGRCAHCRKPISPRYVLVELLTGLVFAACWITYGKMSALAALAICLVMAGMIAATFIDVAHLIIPDEITLGGMGVGAVCALLAPGTHWDLAHRRFLTQSWPALRDSVVGMIVGAGVVYGIVRLGKLLFGRYKITLPEGTKIYFGETSVTLPDEELPYEEVFYRGSDAIIFQAARLELVDRCYCNVRVKLQPARLQIGEETMEPDKAPFMEAVTAEMSMPREAMGLGDVKFMGAIGAFLGWPATIFALGLSAVIGLIVSLTLIAAGQRACRAGCRTGPTSRRRRRFGFLGVINGWYGGCLRALKTPQTGISWSVVTTATEHCHIVTDPRISGGEPLIKGSRTTVRAVVESWRMGKGPEEINQSLPHLSLAQIFDALSYYSDHQDEIHGFIARNEIPEEKIDPRVKHL